jgi:hypothetical protein
MHQDGFNSIQKGKDMNTLITCNQFKEMEEARQNRYNRFLAGCPNRIGSGEPQREALRDADPGSRGEEALNLGMALHRPAIESGRAAGKDL